MTRAVTDAHSHATREAAPALLARRLTTTYGRRHRRGIEEVDLVVHPGEVVGLVGANGAGKTTFMRTLLDFVRPSSGSVGGFGLDSVRDGVALRRRITYLPGEVVLPRQLTGHEVLHRYTSARASVPPDRVARLAHRLDLDLTRHVGELSKGNRQKIGLVLAFAPLADLLVLDEPTSGLDPVLQREFIALVRERTQDGAAVLLSSHVMSEVQEVADRVALLRQGRLQACSDVATVLASSRRRAQVRPAEPTELAEVARVLQTLDGVSDVRLLDDRVDFAWIGDMDPLVKALATFRVASLDIAHADLEDAFFHPRPGETGGVEPS